MTMTNLDVTINFAAAYRYDDAAKVYVSYCPTLKMYSQGHTRERALSALGSAVSLFLKACFDRGIWDSTLRELGFTHAEQFATFSPDDIENQFSSIKPHFKEITILTVPLYFMRNKPNARSIPCPA